MKIPTDRNGNPKVTNAMKCECMGEFSIEVVEGCCDYIPGCPVCGGDGYVERKHDIPWDTVKDIYKRMAAVAAEEPNDPHHLRKNETGE